MSKRLVAGFLVLLATVTAGDLQACGDKFLVLSRGTRFQRPAAARAQAAILIYATPASTVSKAIVNAPIDETLRKAGYKPTLVTSATEFDAALGRARWDLVLFDVADAAAVTDRLTRDATTVVLPVVYNMSGRDLAQARQRYQHILKSPTKSQAFLDAIDDALASRPRTTAKETGKAGE